MNRYDWRPYVPVAVRRAQALKKMGKLRRNGLDIKPVEITGRKIARTFWGEAWCDHLESFSDYANRLPRGRTYVRNGSVCHLAVDRGAVTAMVSGSQIYTVEIAVETLPSEKWRDVKTRCAGQIGSLLELLEGKLSDSVMSVVTDRDKGLFPLPQEISLNCNCLDWATMCKHVAAVLYGVGARLDHHPELLFLLRGVDQEELISAEVDVAAVADQTRGSRRRIADDAVADVFGIEMGEEGPPAANKAAPRRKKVAPKSTKHDGGNLPVTPVTGQDVVALRTKFGMSQSEFARLLGVSAPSISNWERRHTMLSLQTRTLKAWKAAKKLTKRQAWRKLNGS